MRGLTAIEARVIARALPARARDALRETDPVETLVIPGLLRRGCLVAQEIPPQDDDGFTSFVLDATPLGLLALRLHRALGGRL